jgi:hypothetical protein
MPEPTGQDEGIAPPVGTRSLPPSRNPERSMRRWTIRRRLWLVVSLITAAGIAETFEIGPWIAVLISVLALRLVLRLESRPRLREGLRALVLALVLLTGLRVLAGLPYVVVSARSPDGRMLAELVETDWFIDRHFKVRLTTRWLGTIPRRKTLFRSPDEGPRGGERLLWSREGRYLLLVGPNLSTVAEACLASGDKLYLLVDTSTGSMRANADQTRHARFSVGDLAGMDFGVPLGPEGQMEQRGAKRCLPLS